MSSTTSQATQLLCLVVYNDVLTAVGEFTEPGGNLDGMLAVWDGFSWNRLGLGLCSGCTVIHQGDLVAGANYGGHGPARWDGTSWQILSEEVGPRVGGLIIHNLAVYEGDLIMGGYFCVDACCDLARWDGTSWRSLGSGVSGDVWALTIYDGALVVGGTFTGRDA